MSNMIMFKWVKESDQYMYVILPSGFRICEIARYVTWWPGKYKYRVLFYLRNALGNSFTGIYDSLEIAKEKANESIRIIFDDCGVIPNE